jgi:L-lysine 2,3-aminomutase
LKQLSERLVDNGILPYYLHQLDKVQGAAHFEAGVDKGKDLIEGMTACLSGYAVPKYVQEVAGASSKTPLWTASKPNRIGKIES